MKYFVLKQIYTYIYKYIHYYYYIWDDMVFTLDELEIEKLLL